MINRHVRSKKYSPAAINAPSRRPQVYAQEIMQAHGAREALKFVSNVHNIDKSDGFWATVKGYIAKRVK